MSTQTDVVTEQLVQICRISGARWAVWLQRVGGDWQIIDKTRLSRARQNALTEFLHTSKTAAWLAGSMQTGRVRFHSLSELKNILGCQRVYSFATPGRESILLVGADGLSAENQSFFRILLLNEPAFAGDRPVSPAGQGEIRRDRDIGSPIAQQKFLYELALIASSSKNTEPVVRQVIENLCVVFETDRAAVFLLSADGKRLREYARQHGSYPLVLPVDKSLAGIVIERGEAFRYGDLTEAPRFFGDASGIHSVLAVPLKNRNHVIGVLMVESSQPDYFTEQDEKFFVIIANLLSGMLVNIDAYHETRLRARNLDLIHQVVQHIVGMTDEADIAQRTADLMAEYFGFEFSIILVPGEACQNLVVMGAGGTKAHLLAKNLSFPVTKGIPGQVYRTGESFFSNEVRQHPDYFGVPGWSPGAEICVPLREADQIIGVIDLVRSRDLSFSESDQILVESLAGILSSVMMNARRYKQLEDEVIKLEAVRQTALDIAGNLDLDILLKRVVHRTRDLVRAKGAEIGLIEDEKQGIRVQTSENPWYDFSGHLIPPGKGIAGQILILRQPVRIADYNLWAERLQLDRPADFKAAAGVPLMFKDQVIGTLVVMDDQPDREFSDDDMATLELIARNISLAIHNAQLYQDLQESIEAQRQAESRLIQSERMAAAGRLTASIAHEINNPLQALHNCLHLAERNELTVQERSKYLAMARSELDRLITTVQRMLDFYRPGARDRQQTDINQLVSHIVALVEPQLTKNHIRISTDLANELPFVLAVPSQIQQVLLNLVLNAMEAMPDGGDIYLQTTHCESLVPTRRKTRKHSAPYGVEIVVRDTGPGVPIGERERIFEPFVSSKTNGIGLGLSVSYGIIQAHGGTLNLVADDQSGACFRIILPEEKSV
jgi:signal transduction histidine kinase